MVNFRNIYGKGHEIKLGNTPLPHTHMFVLLHLESGNVESNFTVPFRSRNENRKEMNV